MFNIKTNFNRNVLIAKYSNIMNKTSDRLDKNNTRNGNSLSHLLQQITNTDYAASYKLTTFTSRDHE